MPLGGVIPLGGVAPWGGVIPLGGVLAPPRPATGEAGRLGRADGTNGVIPGTEARDVGRADGRFAPRPAGMGDGPPSIVETGGTPAGVYEGETAFGGVSSLLDADAKMK